MKEKEYLPRVSRKLAFILRHRPDLFQISINSEGWCLISDIIKKGTLGITRNELFRLVETDSKSRYQISFDKKFIRANQGHSTSLVNMEYNKLTSENVPDILYHGTSIDNLNKIMASYISCMSRQYVHLSPDTQTAIKVGSRHGKVAIIKINSQLLIQNQEIFLSNNGVFLTKDIDKSYIIEIMYP